MCFSPHEFTRPPCFPYNCRNSATFFVDPNPPSLSTLVFSTRRGKIFFQAFFYNIFHPQTVRNGKLWAMPATRRLLPVLPLWLSALNQGHFMCDFWRRKCHAGRPFSEYFAFHLLVSLHQCSTLIPPSTPTLYPQEFYVHGSVHLNSILISCNSMQVFIYCKITLHVSGVHRTHHQEYIKL